MTESPKLDLELLHNVMSLQPTLEEVATVFGISESQLKRLIANDPEIRQIMEAGSARGKLSLRRVQWRQATGFGPQATQMAIWLGKQWLGQTEKSEVDINANIRVEGGANGVDDMLKGIRADLLTQDEVMMLAELCDLVQERGVARLSNVERIRFFQLIEKASVDPDEAEPAQAEEVKLLPPPAKEAA